MPPAAWKKSCHQACQIELSWQSRHCPVPLALVLANGTLRLPRWWFLETSAVSMPI